MSEIKKTELSFLDRLEIEEHELQNKVEKLEDFIDNNPSFEEVNDIQRILLVTQLNAMKMYLYTLQERIYNLLPQTSN